MMQSSKKMMKEFSLIRFYIVLIISIIYFGAQLVISHWAHSLMLQIDAYHMFYNILCLITCIVTVRMSKAAENNEKSRVSEHTNSSTSGGDLLQTNTKGSVLKNTFGWTRIDVCGTAANLCFLAALCFSVVAESLQTMAHASHHYSFTRTMVCDPDIALAVPVIGAIGLLVNGFCVLTIGGYTFHQTSLLNSEHESVSDDVGNSSSVKSYVKQGIKSRRRQSLVATFRDLFGTVFVILTGLTVYKVIDVSDLSEFDIETMCNTTSIHKHNITAGVADNLHEGHNSDNPQTNGPIYYLDPGLCIVTVIILILLSLSYAKKAGHILLLTIPDHINVKSLEEELHRNIPEICDIHDLHVWQLTPERIIASAHIVVQHTQGYLAIQNSVVEFLISKGISHVTLQPEFVELQGIGDPNSPSTRHRKCFLPCEKTEDCREKQCCESTLTPCHSHQPINDLEGSHSHSHASPFEHHHHHHHHHAHSPKPSKSVFPIKINSDDDITPVEEAELQPMI